MEIYHFFLCPIYLPRLLQNYEIRFERKFVSMEIVVPVLFASRGLFYVFIWSIVKSSFTCQDSIDVKDKDTIARTEDLSPEGSGFESRSHD